ncbi:rna binding protein [Nannochloropsis oceanica]
MAVKKVKTKTKTMVLGTETGQKVSAKASELEARLAKMVDDNDGLSSSGSEAEDPNSTTTSDDDGKAQKALKTKSADFVALSAAVQEKLVAQALKQKKQEVKAKAHAAAAAAKGSKPNAVVYLGHIPHGFFEEQMKSFFSQFGGVKHVRLSRSKKTGKSRGYAFLEFDDAEVATVVAETMQGYYLGGRKLVCEVLPPTKVHPKLFVDADKKWRVIPWRQLEKDRRTAPKTEVEARKCLSRLVRGDKRKRRKLAAKGIEYEFPGYEATAAEAYVKRKKDDPAAAATAIKDVEKSEGKTGGRKGRAMKEEDKRENVGAAAVGGKKRRVEQPEVEVEAAAVVKGGSDSSSSKKKAKILAPAAPAGAAAAAIPAPVKVVMPATKKGGKRARGREEEMKEAPKKMVDTKKKTTAAPVATVKAPAAAPAKASVVKAAITTLANKTKKSTAGAKKK